MFVLYLIMYKGHFHHWIFTRALSCRYLDHSNFPDAKTGFTGMIKDYINFLSNVDSNWDFNICLTPSPVSFQFIPHLNSWNFSNGIRVSLPILGHSDWTLVRSTWQMPCTIVSKPNQIHCELVATPRCLPRCFNHYFLLFWYLLVGNRLAICYTTQLSRQSCSLL